MEDIKCMRCDSKDCLERAYYATPGVRAHRCREHLEAGMVFEPRRKCKAPTCKNISIMGCRLDKPEYCEYHAPAEYISLVNTKCKGCDLVNIVDPEGYCPTCHPETIKRYRLAKQRAVINWLDSSKYTKDYFSIDKVLPETLYCKTTKYRPDIVYTREEGYTIIIEVDEHQHNKESYRTCELPRMINLHSDLMQPTYIIRYNPDDYRNKNGKVVKDGHIKRKKTLLKWIEWVKDYGKEGKVVDGLHVLYLFYDGYKPTDTWITIDEMKCVK
jgi:hypothetical protein